MLVRVRPHNSSEVYKALGLGALAYLVNLGSSALFDTQEAAAGNVFVFLSAQLLGVIGAAYSLAIAAIPRMLLGGEVLFGLRLIVLGLLLGVVSKAVPRVPPVAFGTLVWICLVGPIFRFAAQAELLSPQQLLAAGAMDLLCISLSTLLCLSSSVWGQLHERPRPITPTEFLSAAVLNTGSAVLFCSVLMLTYGAPLLYRGLSDWNSFYAVTGTLLGGLAFLAILAHCAARVFAEETGPSAGLAEARLSDPRGGLPFSGASSHFWRHRKEAVALTSSQELKAVPATPSDAATLELSLGICEVSPEGLVEDMNARFRELASVPEPVQVGRPLLDVPMHETVKEHLQSLLGSSMSAVPRVSEVRVQSEDQTVQFLEFQVRLAEPRDPAASSNELPALAPIDSLRGKKIIVELHDITSRRTVETQLLRAQKLESMGIMLHEVADSFCRTATTITGYTQLALLGKDAEARTEALQSLGNAVREVSAVAARLLHFSTDHQETVRTVALDTFLKNRRVLFQKIVGSSCTLNFSDPPTGSDALRVECDPNLLSQAITNVLQNARDAYPSTGGVIEFELAREEIAPEAAALTPYAHPGSFARVRIRDFGSGMTPEVLSRAFDPLFTTKQERGGTGLGLTIVFATVRAYDGFLTAESSIGKGTTISLYFPISEKAAAVEPAEQPAGDIAAIPALAGTGVTVAVLEPDEGLRVLLSEFLKARDFSVTVDDGSATDLSKLTSGRSVHLLVVGSKLPSRDGREVAGEWLRQKWADNAILLGAPAAESAVPELIPELAPLQLNVPFDLRAFAETVEQALRSAK